MVFAQPEHMTWPHGCSEVFLDFSRHMGHRSCSFSFSYSLFWIVPLRCLMSISFSSSFDSRDSISSSCVMASIRRRSTRSRFGGGGGVGEGGGEGGGGGGAGEEGGGIEEVGGGGGCLLFFFFFFFFVGVVDSCGGGCEGSGG